MIRFIKRWRTIIWNLRSTKRNILFNDYIATYKQRNLEHFLKSIILLSLGRKLKSRICQRLEIESIIQFLIKEHSHIHSKAKNHNALTYNHWRLCFLLNSFHVYYLMFFINYKILKCRWIFTWPISAGRTICNAGELSFRKGSCAKQMISHAGKEPSNIHLVKCMTRIAGNKSIRKLVVAQQTTNAGQRSWRTFHVILTIKSAGAKSIRKLLLEIKFTMKNWKSSLWILNNKNSISFLIELCLK